MISGERHPFQEWRLNHSGALQKGGIALMGVGLAGLAGDALVSNLTQVSPIVGVVSTTVGGLGILSFGMGGGFGERSIIY